MKTLPLVTLMIAWLSTVVQSRAELTSPPPAPPDPRQIMITVGRLLEQGHYTRHKLDSEMSGRILDSYLQALDSNKLFFTQEDIDQIRQKYQSVLGGDLLLGELGPAKEIYAIFRSRLADRVAKIQTFLKKDFSFKSNRTVAIDRHKEPWPANLAEADNLWRDRIEGELLQEKLNPAADGPPAKVVGKRYNQLLTDVQERENNDLLQLFLDSVAQAYDPHTEYLGPSQLDRFETRMRLSYSGIGAELRSEGGYAKISRIIPGGPAEATGKIQVGDRITAVAQGAEPFVDAVDLRLQKVIEMIRGKLGTTVRLQVISAHSADPSKRTIVEIARDNVKLTDQEARGELIKHRKLDGSVENLGWITLPSFYHDMSNADAGKSTSRDVAALLERFQKEKIQGLVIDLRNNGGGSLEEAIKMTGLFVTRGPIVQVKGADGSIDVLKDNDSAVAYSGPLIVLVNKLSASASEIFAAALQDYGRALIVGDSSTFGKGTVQAVYELGRFLPTLGGDSDPDAGALKPTIQKFYRVAGGSTQLRGVLSDVEIPAITDNPDYGETSLDRPLPYDEVEPVPIRIEENRRPLFADQLRRRSSDRVAQDPEFQDIAEQIRKTAEAAKNNRLSLNEQNRRAEIEAEKKLREREIADAGRVKQSDQFSRFQLKLADLSKEELLPIDPLQANSPEKQSAPDRKGTPAAKTTRKVDIAPLPALGKSEITPSSDAVERETLNILSDLIDLNKVPSVSDSEAGKKSS
jgi:carboxyl-terminal processing protease